MKPKIVITHTATGTRISPVTRVMPSSPGPSDKSTGELIAMLVKSVKSERARQNAVNRSNDRVLRRYSSGRGCSNGRDAIKSDLARDVARQPLRQYRVR